MGKYVIEMNDVSKAFKKHSRRKQFLTLKSTLIRDLWRLTQEKKVEMEEEENHFWALRNFDLKVKPGETVGLIGSNGSGKSTALKIIAGILKPTKGDFSVNGRISALIELGAGFHPEISGRENIFINGIMLGLTKQEIRSKFDEIVEFAELGQFIDNPVRTYSSGMFMRLGFAVAVHVNPDILLIDEVLAVGDQSFIHKCLERIFDFKRRGKTIIVVSHDLGSVEKLCSRVVWLSKGVRKDQGRPRKVIGSYLLSVAQKEEERYATEHEQVQEALDDQVAKLEEETRQEDNPNKPIIELPSNAEATGKRWGNRKAEITRFRVLDSNNKERYLFKTGEKVTFEIQYKTREPLENVVFGVGLYLQDGTWCYGSNSIIEGKRIEKIDGSGWVRVTFPELNLLQNTYMIDAAIHAEDTTPFDFHSRMYRIAFRSRISDSGVFRPAHEWSFSDNLDIIDMEADEQE